MLEFRRTNRNPGKPGRSVDGFISRNSSLDPAKKNQELKHHEYELGPRKDDSFTAQSQLDSHFAKALENHAALPITPNYELVNVHENTKKRFTFRRGLKYALRGSGVLVVCALLVGGFIFGKTWLAAHKIFQGGGNSSVLFSTDVKPETLKGEGDGRVNVLLVGIGGGDRDGANLTDSIVIASIDPVAKDITLLSVPRDLWVRVPDYWSMKINAAYSSGLERAYENESSEKDASAAGFAVLEDTIEEYIGIPIHYHALVNFKAFREGVDAVGGVDVDVKEDLYDYVIAPDNDNNPLIARAGMQTFDGRRALLYAQSRYTTSDFARGERQRQLLIALKEKVLTTGTFSNPNTVSKLVDALGDNVTINASLGEIMRMYEITKDVPSTSIATVGLSDEANPLVTTASINEQSVVIPRAGQEDYSQIQAFVRNTLRDPFLKSENATIAVLNGTATSGLATKKSELLKSYGYNVIIIDDAPTKDYAQTVVYDRTSNMKKYTRNYLQNRLGVSVSEEPTSANPILATADFIVVLGQNEITETSD